jgi:signal transduction histidine kinase
MSPATLLIVTADTPRWSIANPKSTAVRHWAAAQLPRLRPIEGGNWLNTDALKSDCFDPLPLPTPDWAQALFSFGYQITTIAAADLWPALEQQPPDLVLIELPPAPPSDSPDRHRFSSFESAAAPIGPDEISADGLSAVRSTDFRGNDLDGMDLGGAVRHRYGLPVVYVLADASAAGLAQTEMTAPYGYLLPPFQPQAMHLTLTTALARSGADRQMQDKLRKYEEQAALKSRFVAVASHEFRNPLNAILFSSELLQRYGGEVTPTKRDTYFDRIHTSVKRISHLLDNVLTIGESDAGQLKFTPQPLDIVAFCEEVIAELEPAGTSKIEFIAPADSVDLQSAPDGEFDEKLLRHILSNLISNAIKYSPQGQPIQFALTLRQREAQFVITDHGIGISQHDQAQLFTSFHRGSNARSIPGTGLGLSIVKQCVELHGGQIAVESVIDEGSRFTVTLPLNINRPSHPLATSDLGSEICA